MNGLKRTPLYPIYEKYGAKVIDFGGWELPVQFSRIQEEHEAVRTKAGLFDVSHMGEVLIQGKEAEPYLQKMVTNDIAVLEPGKVVYTPMCYPDGGTVDDLLVYRKEREEFLVVINAANIEKDVEWLQKHIDEEVEVHNISDQLALLALQGPKAVGIIQSVTNEEISGILPFHFKKEVELAGVPALISRTGYTGEDGFEMYVDQEDAIQLWEQLMDAGQEEGLIPCGLGARDTLRFEARLPLYGQELSPNITPIEAGVGFAVKVNKEEYFHGKETLQEQKEHGAPRKLVGIEMIDRGIPRHGYSVWLDDQRIGEVTTGTQSPTLQKNIGLALIDSEYAKLGQELQVQIRHKKRKAMVVKTPFYRRPK